MNVGATSIITFSAALGSGLIAGVFFAFSSFVVTALSRVPVSQAVAAMQAINVAVLRSLFMAVFLGTAGLCAVLMTVALFRWGEAGSGFLLASGALYLVGTILVTIAFNVPLNNMLASLKPEDASTTALWSRYVSSWTTWNHVRTISALAALAGFMVALLRQRSIL